VTQVSDPVWVVASYHREYECVFERVCQPAVPEQASWGGGPQFQAPHEIGKKNSCKEFFGDALQVSTSRTVGVCVTEHLSAGLSCSSSSRDDQQSAKKFRENLDLNLRSVSRCTVPRS
jgi:hypothetical protein